MNSPTVRWHSHYKINKLETSTYDTFERYFLRTVIQQQELFFSQMRLCRSKGPTGSGILAFRKMKKKTFLYILASGYIGAQSPLGPSSIWNRTFSSVQFTRNHRNWFLICGLNWSEKPGGGGSFTLLGEFHDEVLTTSTRCRWFFDSWFTTRMERKNFPPNFMVKSD